MDNKTIAELTAQIVSSTAGKKEMGKDEVIAMIREVSAELKAIDNPPVAETPAEPEPAKKINPMRSIKAQEVICLICGKGGFKTLTRHLRSEHNIEPKEYKKQFGIPAKVSLTAKEYAEKRSAVAKANDLGAKLQAGRKAAKEKKEVKLTGKKPAAKSAPKKSTKKPEVVQVPE
jgi:predicted transcriptional regulator